MPSLVRSTAVLAVCTFAMAGCSPLRPILYPNQKYQEAGAAQVQKDVDECMALGDQFVSETGKYQSKAKDAAVETAKGGAFGAAVGAVGGAVWGDPGKSAAAGAATGATAGFLNTIFGGVFQSRREPNPTYANFVQRCLAERGYETLGWE
ncbi:YMGG-like glycine zipper-containing protein [Candidatus Binatia bacterium]|nr:YMGG-like glycine zipper-containing protein [Candidatus Binatia bacterium]